MYKEQENLLSKLSVFGLAIPCQPCQENSQRFQVCPKPKYTMK
jgi:hypothetical protein